MQKIKILLTALIFLPLLFSCNKELNVNADWKEITVVYGLLNQDDSLHDIKITKAFLGPGNALDFARIPDSSNFSSPQDVKMEEWNGTTLIKTFSFDTATITNKEAGDSIFYYPDQLVYRTTGALNENYTYKLIIKNPKTGSEITSQTTLIHTFDISKPQPPPAKAVFQSGKLTTTQWYSAENGRRYQLVIRFHYLEFPKNDTSSASKVNKYLDWVVFTNEVSTTLTGGVQMEYNISGDAFFVVLGGKIPVDPTLARTARDVEYIFSVASDDLNTYMDVTEPSNSVVQERPSFTNIDNGIGLFASRYDNRKSSPRILQLSNVTLAELKVNPYTKDLGF